MTCDEKGKSSTSIQSGTSRIVTSRRLEQKISYRQGSSREVWDPPGMAECLPFLEVRGMAIESAGLADQVEQA